MVKMETLPVCLSIMGPPTVASAGSLPLTTATNTGVFMIWMTNYCSGLFSKLNNLLLGHSSLKEKNNSITFL